MSEDGKPGEDGAPERIGAEAGGSRDQTATVTTMRVP
jgi:hypothetical protein